jgi:hypothetical protein
MNFKDRAKLAHLWQEARHIDFGSGADGLIRAFPFKVLR